MDNVNQEIAILNNLLQGAYIGIDSYSKCINRIRNKDIRHRLEHEELEQKEIAMELASRIRDLGGTPKESAGAKGTMASFMGSLKLAENEDTIAILDILTNGVKMEIQSNERAAAALDGPSKLMVEKHLNENRKSLENIGDIRNGMLIY